MIGIAWVSAHGRIIVSGAVRRLAHCSALPPVFGRTGNVSDQAVLEFTQGLTNADELKPKVDNARNISQTADEKKDIMNYMIECVFKLE